MTRHFKGRELAMAFGATLCVSRLGSVLNFFCAPALQRALGVPGACWAAAGACLASVGFVAAYAAMEGWVEREKHKGEYKESE